MRQRIITGNFVSWLRKTPDSIILRYLILGAKGAPVEQLIHTLEQYCNVELDEKWLYELAELYNAAIWSSFV